MAARDGSPRVEEEWDGLFYVMKVPAAGGVYRDGLSADAAKVSGGKMESLTYWPLVLEKAVEVIWNEPADYPASLCPGEGADVRSVVLCVNEDESRFAECEAFSWVAQPQLDEFEVRVKPNATGRVRQIHVSMHRLPLLQPFQFVILQAAD